MTYTVVAFHTRRSSVLHSNFHHFIVRCFFGLAVCLCAFVCAGDEEEWDQENVWQSELLSGLDKVDVCMERLQQEQEKWTRREGDWTSSVHTVVRGAALVFCKLSSQDKYSCLLKHCSSLLAQL